MPFPVANLVISLELALAIVGAVLLWRLVLSPAARRPGLPPQWAPWKVQPVEFAVFVLFILSGAFILSVAASALAKHVGLRGDAATILNGAGAQLGMLAGVTFYWARVARARVSPRPDGPGVLASGAATFLVSLPLLLVASKAWELLLQALGLPTDRQDLIGMFAHADSPWLLATMILLAVVVAPLTEELVFRAGLYRFLRGVAPRWVALIVSALFFASLHVNWSTRQGLSSLVPLAVLAVMFSLAYERTGRIGTPIVAHALFNLNTVVLILSGAGL